MDRQEFIFSFDWDLGVIVDYNRYLAGKSVVIVGGASQYFDEKELSSFDVVARTNDHAITQGGKCDVIYHTVRGQGLEKYRLLDTEIAPSFVWLNCVDGPWECGLNPWRMAERYDNHFTRWRKSQIGYFTQGEWPYWNPYGPEHEWLNVIHKEHNCKLLTGLVALAHVMRSKAKSIHLACMDLYQFVDANDLSAKSAPGYRHSHFLPGQISFLRQAAKDTRVTFCAPLWDSMEYYDAKFGSDFKKPIR